MPRPYSDSFCALRPLATEAGEVLRLLWISYTFVERATTKQEAK